MRHFFIILLILFCANYSLKAWDHNILINTKNTSLLLAADEGGELRFAYYGDKINSKQINQIHDAWIGLNRPAYPAFGSESNRLSALQIVHSDGNLSLDLVVDDIEVGQNNKNEVTTIKLKDKVYPFEVKIKYEAHYDQDVIETWTEIKHNEKRSIIMKRFDSGFMPIRIGNVWISHLHGNWISETSVTTEMLTPGMKEIKNIDGARNAQGDHPEIMFSLDGLPKENSGRIIGAALCWSGNYKLRIDTDNNFTHNFFAGINDEISEYKLDPKKIFSTPKLAFTYTQEGLGGASRNFHRWARSGMIHAGEKLRDIVLNSWEGAYFDIDEEKMHQMMKDFASMGGELFVMDDGWFGDKYPRDNDHGSLGDWVVNKRKLPNGIEGLITEAKKQGLKFGIWIEPESMNSLSELYEKHPEWAIQIPNRPARYGRGGSQLLLDLSNPEVQDFVFSIVDDLMTKHHEIAYIKWDANASLMNYGSTYLPADKQSHLYIDYHLGLQKVIERIRSKYPDLVMQACGGGGGRTSYGIMPGFDEFWVSDNTDALQRIFIQWGTSYFYPSMAMAQHVSASPNHQTGRMIPIKYRFDVAMTGRLGMEIQPKDMTDSEKEFAKQAISTYKQIRPVIQFGDLYRLISPYDKCGVSSLMYCTPQKNRAVFFAYKMEHFAFQAIPRFRMAGLDPDKYYRIQELNVPSGENPCHLNNKIISGRILLNTGIEITLDKEYSSRVLELVEINRSEVE